MASLNRFLIILNSTEDILPRGRGRRTAMMIAATMMMVKRRIPMDKRGIMFVCEQKRQHNLIITSIRSKVPSIITA